MCKDVHCTHQAFNYKPLMDQGWALTLWASALVSLESIDMDMDVVTSYPKI